MAYDDDSAVATMPPATPSTDEDELRKRRNPSAMPPATFNPNDWRASAGVTQPSGPAMPPVPLRPPDAPASANTMPPAMGPEVMRSGDVTKPMPEWGNLPANKPAQTMPAAPVGPATQRFEDLAAQPRPELHGWKKVLDVIGQFSPIGRGIEANIKGSPQFYDAALARARGEAGAEQGVTEKQQQLETGAAQGQFNTPEKRRAYLAEHPDEFEDTSDFQKNDWILAGKFPQREPPADTTGRTPEETTLHDLMTGNNGQPQVNPDTQKPYTYLEAYGAINQAKQGAKPDKNDKKIDEFVGPDNQRYNTMQRPDNSTYTVKRGAVRQEAGTAAPGDVKDVAAGVISGDIPPDPAKWGYRDRSAIEAELKRQGFNLSQAVNDWQATQKYLSSLNSTQQLRLRQAVTFTRDSLGIIDNLYTQWKQTGLPTGFKDYNHAALVAASHLPGKTGSIATNLLSQISDLTSELGTVYKGGNSSTDESLKLAATNLQADWNDQTFQDAMKRIDQNLRIRSNSIRYSQPEGSSGRYTPPSATEKSAPAQGGFAAWKAKQAGQQP